MNNNYKQLLAKYKTLTKEKIELLTIIKKQEALITKLEKELQKEPDTPPTNVDEWYLLK